MRNPNPHVQAPYYIPGGEQDAQSGSPRSPRSPREGGDSSPGFMSGLGRAITKMARKSLLMHEVVVDPDRMDYRQHEDKSAPRDQLRFLKDEIQETKKAVKNLDEAVAKALSFREKSSRLLEEAHRALSRLEQAIDTRNVKELIDVAVEIKVSARRGITLVDVYGGMGTLGKMATIVIRKQIHHKFDKVIDYLRSLLSQEVGPVLSAPPIPNPDALRTKSVIGMPKTASAPNAAAGGMQGQALAAPVGPAGPCLGAEIRSKHDKVYCIAFVPPVPLSQHSGRASSSLLWWSSGALLEYWADEATTAFAIDRPQTMAVTALAIDVRENIWTGHIKGALRVRRKDSWEYVMEDKAFPSAVKVIVFDEEGQAWVGDETGTVRVWRLLSEEEATAGGHPGGALQCVATLHRSLTAGSNRRGGGREGRSRRNSQLGLDPTLDEAATTAALMAAAAAAAAMNDSHSNPLQQATGGPPSNTASQSGVPPTPQAATVATAASVGDRGWLTSRLFGGDPCNTSTTAKKRPAPTMDGAIRSIHVWGPHAWISAGRSEGRITVWSTKLFQELDSWDCAQFGYCNAMRPLNWNTPTASIRRTNSPGMGGRYASSPATDQGMGSGDDAGSGGHGGSGLPTPHISSSGVAQWRLLTGHENGQLLLWHPDSPRLAPLISIGDTGSPIRGIVVFEDYNLVVTGHHSGELVVFLKPGGGAGAGGADVTLGAGGGAVLGADSRHPNSFGMYRPKKFAIRAHKSAISILQGNGSVAATASTLGTIRLWAARDVAKEAERHGITVHSYDRAASGTALMPSSQSSGLEHTGLPSYLSSGAVTQPHTPSSSRGHPVPGHNRTSSAGTLDAFAPHLLGGMHHASSQSSAMHQSMYGVQQSMGSETVGLRNNGLLYETFSNSSTQDRTSQMSRVPAGFVGTCQTIDYSELSLKKLIGTGAYGKVWLAEWTGCQVAVKELLGFANSGEDACRAWQEMQNEVHLLGSLSHPNIMRFMAVSLDPPTIVMQYYAHGSLFGLLQRARRGDPRALRELTWIKRIEMLRDVAAGMHYLHTRKPPVIHGDLRSPNLLLDLTIDDNRPRYHVKIADFGLARMMNQNSNMVMLSKTTNPRWTAPEVIRDSQIGTAGDVYSFAIIMWEMLTWQQPYEEMMSVQVIFSTVSENSRPDIPADSDLPGNPGVTLSQYKELMEQCWGPVAGTRPSFKQVVDRFQVLREAELQQEQATRVPRSQMLRKGASVSKLQQCSLPQDPSAGDTPSTSAGSTKSDAIVAAGGGMSMFSRLGSGGSIVAAAGGMGGSLATSSTPLTPPTDPVGGMMGGVSGMQAPAVSQYGVQGQGSGGGGMAGAQVGQGQGGAVPGLGSGRRTVDTQPYGMSPISEENSLQENIVTPLGSFRAGPGQGPAGSYLAPASVRHGIAAAGAQRAPASPFQAAQGYGGYHQAGGYSQPGGYSHGPSHGHGTPQGTAAASSSSPFASAQATPASSATSPFASAQGTPGPVASSSASPFASAQATPVPTPGGGGGSPFGAAGEQRHSYGSGHYERRSSLGPAPHRASAGGAGAGAGAGGAGSATNAPHAPAQQRNSSPFAAAQGQHAAVPTASTASASPFAAAQPGVSSPSRFAAAQHNSPFAAAQPSQAQGRGASPFAAPQQQQQQQQQRQQQSASPFGVQDQQQQQQQSASPFGAPAQQSASPFGAPAQQSASPFGAPTQQSASPFGAPVQQSASPFGSEDQQQQQQHGASPFAGPAQQGPSPFSTTEQQRHHHQNPPGASPFAQAPAQQAWPEAGGASAGAATSHPPAAASAAAVDLGELVTRDGASPLGGSRASSRASSFSALDHPPREASATNTTAAAAAGASPARAVRGCFAGPSGIPTPFPQQQGPPAGRGGPAAALAAALAVNRHGSLASSATWSDLGLEPAMSSSPPARAPGPLSGGGGGGASGRASLRTSTTGAYAPAGQQQQQQVPQQRAHPLPFRSASHRSALATSAAAAAAAAAAAVAGTGARHGSLHAPQSPTHSAASGGGGSSSRTSASRLSTTVQARPSQGAAAAAAPRITAHEAAAFALGRSVERVSTPSRLPRSPAPGSPARGGSGAGAARGAGGHTLSPARSISGDSALAVGSSPTGGSYDGIDGGSGFVGSQPVGAALGLDSHLMVQTSSASQPMLQLKHRGAGAAASSGGGGGGNAPSSPRASSSTGLQPVRRTGSITAAAPHTERSSIGRAAAAAAAATAAVAAASRASPVRSSRPQSHIAFGSSSSRMGPSGNAAAAATTRDAAPARSHVMVHSPGHQRPASVAAVGSGGMQLSQPQYSVPAPTSADQLRGGTSALGNDVGATAAIGKHRDGGGGGGGAPTSADFASPRPATSAPLAEDFLGLQQRSVSVATASEPTAVAAAAAAAAGNSLSTDAAPARISRGAVAGGTGGTSGQCDMSLMYSQGSAALMAAAGDSLLLSSTSEGDPRKS